MHYALLNAPNHPYTKQTFFDGIYDLTCGNPNLTHHSPSHEVGASFQLPYDIERKPALFSQNPTLFCNFYNPFMSTFLEHHYYNDHGNHLISKTLFESLSSRTLPPHTLLPLTLWERNGTVHEGQFYYLMFHRRAHNTLLHFCDESLSDCLKAPELSPYPQNITLSKNAEAYDLFSLGNTALCHCLILNDSLHDALHALGLHIVPLSELPKRYPEQHPINLNAYKPRKKPRLP